MARKYDPRPTWYASHVRGAYESHLGECAVAVVWRGDDWEWRIGRGDLVDTSRYRIDDPMRGVTVKSGKASTRAKAQLKAITEAKKYQKACRIALR